MNVYSAVNLEQKMLTQKDTDYKIWMTVEKVVSHSERWRC